MAYRAVVFFIGAFVFIQGAFSDDPIVMQVRLPFVDRSMHECMQNSDDFPSHRSTSTLYDLDFEMVVGTIIVAAADGTMHYGDSTTTGFGKYARVDHGNGYWTMYGHLSEYAVEDGKSVKAGDYIAKSGNTGTSTGPHVHFGVHSGDGVGRSQRMEVYAKENRTGSVGYFATGKQGEERDFHCRNPKSGDTNVPGYTYEALAIACLGTVCGDALLYHAKLRASRLVLFGLDSVSVTDVGWRPLVDKCEEAQQYFYLVKDSLGSSKFRAVVAPSTICADVVKACFQQ